MKKFMQYLVEDIAESQFDCFKPIDETEDANLMITDDALSQAKILAYNVGQQAHDDRGKKIPVTPKKFPDKAVDIVFPIQNLLVEVFLDTNSKKWDSHFNYNGHDCKLSPDQMGQFFTSNFYARLQQKLSKSWPLTDDLYGKLFEGISNKEMLVGPIQQIEEDSDDKQVGGLNSGHDAAEPKYSASGRKLMNFGDIGVKNSSAKFTCWPQQNKEFRWSQWKDWRKIKPICRMRFSYSNGHEYGISLGCVGEDYNLRGFRSYDLTQQPPLAWLSKDENDDLMNLSLFNKFVRFCAKRIQHYIDMPTEEIYAKINNPDKISIEDIDQTKMYVRKTLNEIIKKKQSDSFKWK